MKIQTKINNKSFLFLIFFSTSFISLATIKKVNIQDIRISGSKLLTQNDVANISTLKFPTRLLFIQTNLLEKELRQNLSLKNVSVSRQIFPFGLKVQVKTRTPIAYGERILNGEKISGFIDKDGIFINKQNVEEIDLSSLNIQIFGWKERFQETLSEILIARDNYEFEIVKITFSPNGFLTLEEKNLKNIFLGFNPNLINYQLQIINDLKIQFKKNNFYEKIDSIDITDPNKPKIKVFKP